MEEKIRVLAIDPGFERVGIAIIDGVGNKADHIYSETYITSRDLSSDERIFLIGKKIEEIINIYKPEECAVEKLFFNSNQTTAMKVSESRGVSIFQAQEKNIKISEYTPLQVKIAVCGYGRASKKDVVRMVDRLIKIKSKIKYDDEYDAIAIGITHLASRKINKIH